MVGERAHLDRTAGELEQRQEGERQLEGEDHLHDTRSPSVNFNEWIKGKRFVLYKPLSS
jgi:hypothetical protein